MAFAGYIWRHHLEVRMTDFHSVHTSSNLVGATNININKLIKPTIMNNKDLTKMTKKELIELLKSVIKQNEQLVIIKEKCDKLITLKDDTIRLIKENEELQDKIINYKSVEIEQLKHIIKKLKKQIKYSIISQIAIIVSALLIILFI